MFMPKIAPQKLRHSLAARIFHWIFALSFFILFYTGLYIAHPGLLPLAGMGRARQSHLLGQILFLGSILWRIWYSLAYKKAREIIPTRKDLAKLAPFLRYELFLTKKEPKFPKYNVLQKIIFTSWLPLSFLFAISGFALYSSFPFNRLEGMFGGMNRARRHHYLFMLLFSSTVFGHIYLTATSSAPKLKSIFTGYIPFGAK